MTSPGLFEWSETQAPRTCNTGALNRCAKIDWLEFTVSGVAPGSAIVEYLGLDPSLFTAADYGMGGYSDFQEYGFVKVLHSSGKPERGTKIILSSRALDEVGKDAVEIIKLVLRDGGTFARIDLALDDRTGKLTLDKIAAEVEKQKDVNRFSQYEIRKPINRNTRELAGYSIYWGKAASSRQVVIYDKQIERLVKASEETGPWVRCEVRWKKRAANMAAAALAVHGLEKAGALVRGVIDFREVSHSEIEKRAVCSWWADWTESLEIIRTGIRKAVKTIEEKVVWLGLQVKKALGQVTSICGADIIRGLAEEGIKATSCKEWSILDPLNRRLGIGSATALDTICPF